MATKIKGKQIELSTLADDSTLEESSGLLQIKNAGIVNAKIADATIAADKLAGSIGDAKLLTISTSGKVAGSAVQLQSNKGLSDSSGLGVVVKENAGIFVDGGNGLAIQDEKITNAHLAGSIANAKLANSAMTIGGTSVSLGGSIAASALASAVDGEAMALTAVTDLDAAANGNLTIFDTLLGASGNTLTIGAHNDSVVIIKGDLQVDGDQTVLNTSILQVEDLSIEVAKAAETSAQADGAGLNITGAGVTFQWDDTNSRMNLNKILAATSFVGDVAGNASTASALATARQITTTGDVVITATNFDGSANFSAAATIQADAVHGSMLNADVVDDATLSFDEGANKVQVKSAGVKATHLDIKSPRFLLDSSEADVNVSGATGGVRTITLNQVGSTGTTAKFDTSNAAARSKILVFINGVMLGQASAANKVGDGESDDGDYFFANAEGNTAHMTLTLNDSVYSGTTDVLTIYGPAIA